MLAGYSAPTGMKSASKLVKRPHGQCGSVRVKGGMSLRNGMWHGLRNDIIMRNLIYADRFQRNKLN